MGNKILLGDTNIFAIITDPKDHRHEAVDKVFKDIFDNKIELCISEVTLEEIMSCKSPLVRKRQFEIIINSIKDIFVVDKNIEKLAIDLFNSVPELRLPDAKIIITAVVKNIELWTGDYQTILKGNILNKIQKELTNMKLSRLRYKPV